MKKLAQPTHTKSDLSEDFDYFDLSDLFNYNWDITLSEWDITLSDFDFVDLGGFDYLHNSQLSQPSK